MARAKLTAGVTPVGLALFANIMKTETFKDGDNVKDTNKFTIQLELKESDKADLLAKIEQEWEKYKDTLEGKQFKAEPNFGLREYKDKEYFKFGMTHKITCRDGSTFTKTVPVFDAKKQNLAGKIDEIGNDSKVRVAYELSPYYMSKTNFGVSLRLTALQVIELVERGNGSAEGFGFAEEEGFAAESPESAFDAPMVDAESNDGDF